MRWLFWVLVLANLIGFYWFSLSSDHRASKNAPQPLVTGNGPNLDEATLVLVSEAGVPKLNSSKPEGATIFVSSGIEASIVTVSTEESEKPLAKADIKNDEDVLATSIDTVIPEPEPEPEVEAGVDLEEAEVSLAVATSNDIKDCVLVGPLSEESNALELKEALVSEQIKSELYEKSSAVEEKYWVIIPPLKERGEAKALLRELQERKIDSDIIYEGEYKNGITLGVFGNAENTKKYQNEMKALGYPAEVKPFPRVSRIFWLELHGFKNNEQDINEKKIAELPALVREKLNEQNVSDQVNITKIVCGAGEAGSGLAGHIEKSDE